MLRLKKITRKYSRLFLIGMVLFGALFFRWVTGESYPDPSKLTSPTPIPFPAGWKMYRSDQSPVILKYPVDHFAYGSYPDLEFSNIIHQQGFVMHPVANPGRLFFSLWTVLQVIDKKAAEINSQKWFLSSVGVKVDPEAIPAGDIYFAYNQSSHPTSALPAENMGGLVISRKTISQTLTQYGMTGGGYFIYSSVIEAPTPRYFAVLSLLIPAKNPSASSESAVRVAQAVSDYQLMLHSFNWK